MIEALQQWLRQRPPSNFIRGRTWQRLLRAVRRDNDQWKTPVAGTAQVRTLVDGTPQLTRLVPSGDSSDISDLTAAYEAGQLTLEAYLEAVNERLERAAMELEGQYPEVAFVRVTRETNGGAVWQVPPLVRWDANGEARRTLATAVERFELASTVRLVLETVRVVEVDDDGTVRYVWGPTSVPTLKVVAETAEAPAVVPGAGASIYGAGAVWTTWEALTVGYQALPGLRV